MSTSVSPADLVAWLDGELEPERCRDVEKALAGDPVFSASADHWRRHNEVVRAAFGRIASEPVPPALAAVKSGARPALEAAGACGSIRLAPVDATRAALLNRRRRLRTAIAVTVAFLGGAVTTLAAVDLMDRTGADPVPVITLTAPHFPDAVQRLGLRALQTYAAYSDSRAEPVHAYAGLPALSAFLQDVLGVDLAAPDLHAENLRPVGGRIAPAERGPAAWLLYRGQAGEPVALFVTRVAAVDNPPRYEENGTTGTVFWTASGLGFAVTGPPERDRLARISGAVRAALPLAR